jgi:hypothetical protein
VDIIILALFSAENDGEGGQGPARPESNSSTMQCIIESIASTSTSTSTSTSLALMLEREAMLKELLDGTRAKAADEDAVRE